MENCPHCMPFITEENKLVHCGFNVGTPEFEKCWRAIINGYRKCTVHGIKAPNGKPHGIFGGTLNMSDKDDLKEEDMIKAIKKVMNYKPSNVRRYAWYKEYTEKGLPHIHFIYQTRNDGRIKQQLFERAWTIWNEKIPVGNGHRGGYHALVADKDAYLKYIGKDASLDFENKWSD